MFAYLSALVELLIIDVIYVNFLLVGHTHASIDQYFSVLTRAIKSARFIGSPLAFAERLRTAHEAPEERPYVVQAIHAIYDVVGALAHYINKAVVHIQIPHSFRISLHPVYNKAITEYKIFTQGSFKSTDGWLPARPPVQAGVIQAVDLLPVGRIRVPELYSVGGHDGFRGHLFGTVTPVNYSAAQRAVADVFSRMPAALQEIEDGAMGEMRVRFAAEAAGDRAPPPQSAELRLSGAAAEKALREASTDSAGFIFLLKTPSDKPPLASIIPKLLAWDTDSKKAAAKVVFKVATRVKDMCNSATSVHNRLFVSLDETQTSFTPAYFCPPPGISKTLLHVEYLFWTERCGSWEQVLELHKDDIIRTGT